MPSNRAGAQPGVAHGLQVRVGRREAGGFPDGGYHPAVSAPHPSMFAPLRLDVRLLAGALVVALLAGCSGAAENRTRWSCGTVLEPGAAVGPDGLPGFATNNLGGDHLRDQNAEIAYAFCPPTSGPHFNIQGVGPIRPGFYGPERQQHPGGWVHNLEHGYVLLLYRGGDRGVADADREALRAFLAAAPASPGASACGVPSKLVVARFDRMATRFAILAWDRALLADAFDPAQADAFYQQWVDAPTAPEAGGC